MGRQIVKRSIFDDEPYNVSSPRSLRGANQRWRWTVGDDSIRSLGELQSIVGEGKHLVTLKSAKCSEEERKSRTDQVVSPLKRYLAM